MNRIVHVNRIVPVHHHVTKSSCRLYTALACIPYRHWPRVARLFLPTSFQRQGSGYARLQGVRCTEERLGTRLGENVMNVHAIKVTRAWLSSVNDTPPN